MEIVNKFVYVFINWGIFLDVLVFVSLVCCVIKILNIVESVLNFFLYFDLRLGFLSFVLMFLNVMRLFCCVMMSVKKMFLNDFFFY